MSDKKQGLPVGDRKESMKKLQVVLSVVNGVLAVLVGVLVCLVLPRVEVDFDYLGFLVGVLGVLFAVVLGYNIYSMREFGIKLLQKCSKAGCNRKTRLLRGV